MKVSRIALMLLTGFWITFAAGQTNRGGISGTVSDRQGALVPGATVTITNVGTNQIIRRKTSGSGAYTVSDLDPVVYRIAVEADGFKKAILENVKVDTGSTATADVKLQPGNVETQVTVTSDTTLVNTGSGTLGQTVTERELRDIPLNNRSVLDLAVTLPNVSGEVGSEDPGLSANPAVPGFNLNVNGGRSGSTVILADGVNNTGVGLARAVVSFSPETVQEFTVQTSAYSAEYGSTGGGVINATTKSGTNQFHGTALWYTRNPSLNAAPWTTATVNKPKSNLHWNQLLFSAGGPVLIPKIYNGRDRTFFFAAFEPRYRQDNLQQDSLFPTAAMRTGDFSGLSFIANNRGFASNDFVKQFNLPTTGDTNIYQEYIPGRGTLVPGPLMAGSTKNFPAFPGNILPQNMLDPMALKALQYLPVGKDFYINGAGGVSNLVTFRAIMQNEKRLSLRLDHILSSRQHLNFRLTSIPAIGENHAKADELAFTATYSYSRQMLLGYTYNITPNVFNNLQLNYTRGRFSTTYAPAFDIKTGRNLAKELGQPSLTHGGMPQFDFDYGSIGSQGSTLNDNTEERYNIADTVYVSRGAMSWKFGVDLSHALLNELPEYGASGKYGFRNFQTSLTGTDTTSGWAFASFLLGIPNVVTIRNSMAPYYYRWNTAAGFAQNDWKVLPNLTLNLGLRYSLQLPRTEENNLQGAFRPDLAQTVALPSPLLLTTTGQVITQAVVPPFAYSGRGGRSRYLYPPNYKDFEPRFGFAWAPGALGTHRINSGSFVIRGGYGLSHAALTGNNRLPSPDFTAPGNYGEYSPLTSYQDTLTPMRLSTNPLVINPISPEKYLNIPANGLVTTQSINIPGFVISGNTKTPYVQNWNLSLQWQPMKQTVIETAYVGSKGTHLFMPAVNVNPRNIAYVDGLSAGNQGTDCSKCVVNDPLGRKDANGITVTVPVGDLSNTYLGFQRLNSFYDASANSIRHAAYVSVIRRAAKGLTLTANYTFGKSIDDQSDSSPDKFALSTGRTDGQVTFGGTREGDRSVSTFDIKHSFNSTFFFDLPLGRGHRLLGQSWRPIETVVSGWTISGVNRISSGYPATVTMSDSNLLGSGTHTIRPDIVPGVSVINPLWTRSCPVGALCEPYLNPAAFERPAVGSLGSAPRTLDAARGPWQRHGDLSVQKTFSLREGKYNFQFRMDAINAFNHPNFAPFPNASGGTDIFSNPPDVRTIATADYDAWAKYNNKPLSTTTQGKALQAQVVNLVTANLLPSKALPLNFFTVPLPQGFWSMNANSFDITTLDGYKLYRLHQVQNNISLHNSSQPRFIQLGLKFMF